MGGGVRSGGGPGGSDGPGSGGELGGGDCLHRRGRKRLGVNVSRFETDQRWREVLAVVLLLLIGPNRQLRKNRLDKIPTPYPQAIKLKHLG